MFTIFYKNGIPYGKTWDEIEADTIAYLIGGFYVENRAY